MSLDYKDDWIEISAWNSTKKHPEQIFFDDDSICADEEECRCGNRHGKRASDKIAARFSHWCECCECAFCKEDVSSIEFVCPMCGRILDEFDWREIAGDGGYKQFKEKIMGSLDDGFDPDKYFERD